MLRQFRFHSRAGAYLLDGGDVLFLWLGDQLSPQFVQDLFGVQAKFDVPDGAEVEFGDSSPLASKMSLIVGQLRRDRNGVTIALLRFCVLVSLQHILSALCHLLPLSLSGHPPIKIVQQKAPTESLFLTRLLEDK